LSNKKCIDTLVKDIYNLFSPDNQELSQELLDIFGDSVKDVVKKSIEEARNGWANEHGGLRLSSIGKPDRQLWFDNNPVSQTGDTSGASQAVAECELTKPSDLLKFLYGHILEALLVYLIRQSGHTLDHAQEDLELCGVPGHPDGVLDGLPADIKSASNFAFKMKFANRALIKPGPENDSFGYGYQLKAYREALLDKYPHEDIDKENIAWVVFNKETGEICLLKADVLELPHGSASSRVETVKRLVQQPQPPKEKCYPDVPDGKSGNRVLNKLCGWCKHKDRCWADANGGQGLRTFEYSSGPKWFTQVVKQPRVNESRDYEFVEE